MATSDLIMGILGNIISILVFASPMGTFWQVIKKKSVENYDGLPYISTLLSTSLWTFYGFLDPDDGFLIITVNSVGIVSQFIYVTIYLIYAPKDKKVKSLGLLAVLNLLFLGPVIVITLVVFEGGARRTLIGVLCATLTIGMYAAPLSVMRIVIKTKSVEYMPFLLTFFLFLNGVVWFTFALILKDYYVLVPNAVGIVLGACQLIVHVIYKNKSPVPEKSMEYTMEEGSAHITKEGIKLQDFDEDDDEDKRKTQSLNINNVTSQPEPSMSRDTSTRKFTRTLTMSPSQSRDVENGGAMNIHP